ncbi:MAG: 4-alpha-glucanotransferase, partial [Mariprofundaceae bacterium]|nr:4-alpha-glucanotransferase [Mariprofundaceae bacterium]
MSEVVDLNVRRAGVLLHITSLPSPFAQGVLGIEALRFIDSIKSGGYKVWQFLPLGPTHDHGSPYESLSSSAGNEKLIDLRGCVAENWLDEIDLAAFLADEAKQAEQFHGLLDKASAVFWQQVLENDALAAELCVFKAENASWLDDYALFVALKQCQEGKAWWQWTDTLRDHDADALGLVRELQENAIKNVVFKQFLFARQWQVIKDYAKAQGVLLFGDLPIYVAHDSADVWANRQYFTVNEEGYCQEVAGVPPDYFSETGQRWGNPLYKWDKLAEDGFAWWVERVRTQMQRMDMLRIDHFRGLEAFWVIPADRDDGMVGEWRKADGDALLQALKQAFGSLPIIAEDLGLITDEVHALRKK